MESGFERVSRRHWYFQCPCCYAVQQTGVPTRRKAFLLNYGKQKSANEHLTQTEGVLGLRTVEKRGILLEDLIHYNNE